MSHGRTFSILDDRRRARRARPAAIPFYFYTFYMFYTFYTDIFIPLRRAR